MEGEKEDGTSSGKKCALLAAKRKATMDTTSTEGPVRRYVNCLVTAYVQLHTLAIFPTPSNFTVCAYRPCLLIMLACTRHTLSICILVVKS